MFSVCRDVPEEIHVINPYQVVGLIHDHRLDAGSFLRCDTIHLVADLPSQPCADKPLRGILIIPWVFAFEHQVHALTPERVGVVVELGLQLLRPVLGPILGNILNNFGGGLPTLS